METLERLRRARVQIQKTNSFFAYLSLFLKFQEGKDLEERGAGAGVDIEGNFYYNDRYFNTLNDNEVIGVVLHEILHLAFLHLTRRGSRHPEVWNYSADIVVNQVIKDNGFSLDKNCLISNSKNEFVLKDFGKVIKDCNKKTAEEIYDELDKIIPKVNIGISGKGGKGKGGKGQQKGGSGSQYYDEDGKGYTQEDLEKGRFDVHIEQTGGKKISDEEKRKLERKWKGRIAEAVATSRMRGDIPAGIERLIGKLHESEVNWKELLKRFIQSFIPYDCCYSRPSKKSVSAGIYLPHYLKERISVVIGIDVSGSIGNVELRDFISEVVGMAKAYRSRIEMTLITHETGVNDIYKIENGNIAKIKQLKIRGGGGTSHIDIFKRIKKDIKDCKVAVFLTDGYSDIDEVKMNEYNFGKIFLISKGGSDSQIKETQAKIIHLKKEYKDDK